MIRKFEASGTPVIQPGKRRKCGEENEKNICVCIYIIYIIRVKKIVCQSIKNFHLENFTQKPGDADVSLENGPPYVILMF